MYKSKRKKSIVGNLLIFLIIVVLVSTQASAQLFDDTHEIETIVDETTSVFFLGDVSFEGSFQAVQMDSFIDSFSEYIELLGSNLFPTDLHSFSYWDTIYGFPVFSKTIINQVTVYEINTTILSSIDASSIHEILLEVDQIITTYDQASIFVSDGIALIGSDIQEYTVDHLEAYAVGGLFQLDISQDFPSKGLGMISDQTSYIYCDTNDLFIYPLESTIEIIQNNQTIRKIIDSETILLIKTTDRAVILQDSLLHYFPLLSEDAIAQVTVSIEETDTPDLDILSLFNKINETFSLLGENPLQEFISFNDPIQSMIPLISQILNSGIVIVNSTQPITIGETTTSDVNIIASRGPEFVMNIDQQSSAPITLTGFSSLLFIDDHLFTEAAEQSDNGITYPLWSIILWIAAIGSIFYYLLLRKQNKPLIQSEDKIPILQNRWLKIILPICVIFSCFFIIDLTFSIRFGLSFFTLLSMQTNSMITGLFLLVELIGLVIIFIMYALPIRFLHDMICKTIIRNDYQKITKILVIIPVFWIGIQLYLLVLFNIILSFLPISSLTSLG